MRKYQPRLRTVLSALVVAGVPTYYAAFPGADYPLRAVLFGMWLLFAAFVGAIAARLDERLADFAGSHLSRRSDERFLAGSTAIRSVLACTPPRLRDVDWRLYLPDEKLGRLLPSYESSGQLGSSVGWQFGKGVTGRCWEVGEYVAARGGECSDGTYGLTDEEQQKYQRLEVVAAFPLRTATHQVIGVLTGSSTRDDGSLVSPEGQEWHITTAKVISRLLIDVLRHADDH